MQDPEFFVRADAVKDAAAQERTGARGSYFLHRDPSRKADCPYVKFGTD
jgi:hypothetical protein